MRHTRIGSGRAAVAAACALYVATIIAVLGGFGLSSAPASAEYQYDGKVVVCHRTDTEANPRHTIVVSSNALDAHLGHGDTIGPCPPG